MKRFFVYQITNKINGKVYIGKSQTNLKCGASRWQIHLRISNGGKEKYGRMYSAIHAAINKYGASNFTYKEIDFADDEKQALHLEQCWIAQLKDSNYALYNLTNGGEGLSGKVHNSETKRKISFAQQGEKSSNAMLRTNQVVEIKRLLKSNQYTRKEIREKFHMSKSTIDMIAQGKRWSHVKI